MAAKTRYEDGEIYGVLLPYICGVEGLERGKPRFIREHQTKAIFHIRNRFSGTL